MIPRRPGRGRWSRWVVFAVVEIAVVLVLAELVVRVAAHRHRGLRMLLNASTNATDFSDAATLPELMDRTMLGFSPHRVVYGFRLNSRSFRTREYEPAPAADRFRVVALGDSFTFASGALPHEDHWTTLLENALGRRTGRSVEVLSLGVPDTGPAFQLRLWQLEGARLEPQIVVLAFFVGNDFVDHQGDCGVFGGGERGLSGRLAEVSSLYRAVRNLVRVSSAAGGADPDEATSDGPAVGASVPGYRERFEADRPTFSAGRFVAIEAQRMALCLRSEEDAFRELAGRVADVVIELNAEVRATGSRCVVMLIPDQYQVDGALRDEVVAAAGGSAADYDLDRPQRFLKETLGSAGVEVVDLLPAFREACGAEACYRPRDTHWNRHGNEIAAATLAAILSPRDSSRGRAIFADGLETGSSNAWSETQTGRSRARRHHSSDE